ncbi:hypothetical protein Y032_0079g1297 [Ancylostoma ceylanicum]|uniref:Uncharacterized protein n=1 Tax=Ancylostoma ceylanicum TaxID=53326 RepID=A0A016TTN3_9BILA|nr:hypothetical protein Y032_0079g1297 [Ancylostoma ceylanicum]
MRKLQVKGSISQCSVQDGYSCIKVCKNEDARCLGNHTKEILYQFRALPSMSFVKYPIEVSRIRTDMDTPFSVDYSLDTIGMRHFIVEQDRNIAISQKRLNNAFENL